MTTSSHSRRHSDQRFKTIIPRTPPHDNRSNMSAEQDDQDIELIEHQQFNRGAGLQTCESNVPLNIDQEERMGRQLFSTDMVLSTQMTLRVSDMAVMKETMQQQQQQQSVLDSTIQLGNQTVPLIFGNATPINRPTIIRPTIFSPSSLLEERLQLCRRSLSLRRAWRKEW